MLLLAEEKMLDCVCACVCARTRCVCGGVVYMWWCVWCVYRVYVLCDVCVVGEYAYEGVCGVCV